MLRAQRQILLLSAVLLSEGVKLKLYNEPDFNFLIISLLYSDSDATGLYMSEAELHLQSI